MRNLNVNNWWFTYWFAKFIHNTITHSFHEKGWSCRDFNLNHESALYLRNQCSINNSSCIFVHTFSCQQKGYDSFFALLITHMQSFFLHPNMPAKPNTHNWIFTPPCHQYKNIMLFNTNDGYWERLEAFKSHRWDALQFESRLGTRLVMNIYVSKR